MLPSMLAAALALAATPAMFSYNEHCRISNRALLAAIRVATSVESAPERHAKVAALRDIAASKCTDRDESKSYGDLVARVDVAVSPEDYYMALRSRRALEQWDADEIPWENTIELGKRWLQHFNSMSNNQAHFADRALFGFQLWHQAAIDQAVRGKLNRALVLNAFADHFLQDHFAPGHIFTPRRGLHDVASFGIHDHYNRRGADYLPNSANFNRLERFIEDPDAIISGCGATLACLRQKTRTALRLYGDGQLRTNRVQEEFMVLVFAQSVSDIVQAYLTSRDENSFAPVRWIGFEKAEPAACNAPHQDFLKYLNCWQSPLAQIPFGAYKREFGSGLPSMDRSPIVGVSLHNFPKNSGADERTALSIETLVVGRPGDWLDRPNSDAPYGNPLQLGLLGGADVAFDQRQTSAGPFARLLFAWPQVGVQVSAIYGSRWHDDVAAGNRRWADHWGGRLELGYGILFLGFEVQSDAFVDQGALTRGTVLSPTLSLTLPNRRRDRTRI